MYGRRIAAIATKQVCDFVGKWGDLFQPGYSLRPTLGLLESSPTDIPRQWLEAPVTQQAEAECTSQKAGSGVCDHRRKQRTGQVVTVPQNPVPKGNRVFSFR